MPTRRAQANWKGTLKKGEGSMNLEKGDYTGQFDVGSRFSDDRGTNPEEMIGAAHAGCFSMALTQILEKEGHEPKRVDTRAAVELEKGDDGGYRISTINLDTDVEAAGLDENKLKELAENARTNCTVSKALGNVKINVKPNLAR